MSSAMALLSAGLRAEATRVTRVGLCCKAFSRRVCARGLGQSCAVEEVRGRAGRRGSEEPADLDISRHRGSPEVLKPQVRLCSNVPRAVFPGLLRAAPGGVPVGDHRLGLYDP